jgi:hypothetical protein
MRKGKVNLRAPKMEEKEWLSKILEKTDEKESK